MSNVNKSSSKRGGKSGGKSSSSKINNKIKLQNIKEEKNGKEFPFK